VKLEDFGPPIVYRAVSLQYLRWVQSAKGSRLVAGRFNPKDISANYFGLEPETAFLEYQQGNPEPLPVAIVGFKVDIKAVVDLRGPATLPSPFNSWRDDWKDAALGLSSTCPSWECCREVLALNGSGILFPSQANPSGSNLVVYPEDSTAGAAHVAVIDPDKLISKYADVTPVSHPAITRVLW